VVWRLSGDQLYYFTDSGNEFSVRVLAEELAYNKSLKQFKMFIIDRPLDPKYKVEYGRVGVVTLHVECTHSVA